MKRSVQCLLFFGLFALLFSAQASAVSGNLVIAHVQAGAASGQTLASSQEFITVYNNSTAEVDVTNWCVSSIAKVVGCLKPESDNLTFFLPAHTYMTFVSDNFLMQHPNYVADVVFQTTNATSGSIVGGSDSITLKDALGVEIDRVSWSSSSPLPAGSTSSLAGGTILQRRTNADLGTMIDTDLPADFTKITGLVLPVSSVYEVVTVIDECSNMPELQNEVPVGFLKNEQGECLYDQCSNIDGLQMIIPEEFLRSGINDCKFDYVPLKITELLPNAAGSDSGHEYIELFNPSDREAFLINYVLKVGSKTYTFPAGLKIAPGEYMAFYNNELTFTLANTTGFAVLLDDDGSIVSQSDPYIDPKDDIAWALIDERWQYTNQLTFASMNVASIFEPDTKEELGERTPCAANQYRHPETNRCRLLVTVASPATACKDGQYRSEETNRCRAIALAGGTLTPCKDNQYRSEETNRCRNLSTLASTLTPCKDNQYRSEATNRCRTISAAAAPVASFAVESIADASTSFIGWSALGGIGAIAFGYAAWEWRLEALALVRKALSFFTQR